MKRGFTLVELMLVVGLMGMMSVIAINSYSAVTRGMSDRAALDVAKSLADAALQRAQLDRSNTYLYLFNEVRKTDSDMSAGIVSGVAIAVRPVGRITMVPEGDLFCDEFGDLNQTFKALDDEGDRQSESEKEQSSSTIRLYSIANRNFATVQEGVYSYLVNEEDLQEDGGKPRQWRVYGFKKVSGDATFKVGDQYGQEFAVTRLPPGYAFSGAVSMSGASSLGQRMVGSPIEIKPTDSSAPSVQVYARRPNGTFESIGSTSQVKDGK